MCLFSCCCSGAPVHSSCCADLWAYYCGSRTPEPKTPTSNEIIASYESTLLVAQRDYKDHETNYITFEHSDYCNSLREFIKRMPSRGWVVENGVEIDYTHHQYILKRVVPSAGLIEFASAYSSEELKNALKADMEKAFEQSRLEAKGKTTSFLVELYFGNIVEAEMEFVHKKQREGWICHERNNVVGKYSKRWFHVPTFVFNIPKDEKGAKEDGEGEAEKNQNVLLALVVT